ELGDDNIWIIERHREIDSLHAIIDRLAATATTPSPASTRQTTAAAADPTASHQSALDKASRPATGEQ
ncbi:hypothetical protein, partial [Mycolicibacterium vanbaalenii]|uniref:hypothetical protein n=1 Tax=Mycolicibacterium vanbaalenii TaxID=110539 RepID=UPI0021F39E49